MEAYIEKYGIKRTVPSFSVTDAVFDPVNPEYIIRVVHHIIPEDDVLSGG